MKLGAAGMQCRGEAGGTDIGARHVGAFAFQRFSFRNFSICLSPASAFPLSQDFQRRRLILGPDINALESFGLHALFRIRLVAIK